MSKRLRDGVMCFRLQIQSGDSEDGKHDELPCVIGEDE